MSQFTFTPFDHNDFLARGYTTITGEIDGFMDGAISLHIHKISLNLGVSVDIRRWNGGYDAASTLSPIEAERNFAHALLAACDIASEIESKGIELMEAYEALHASKNIAV